MNVSLSRASFAENSMPFTRNITPSDEDDEATTVLPAQPPKILHTVIPLMSSSMLVLALVWLDSPTLSTERGETQSVLNFLRGRCTLGSMERNCGYRVS